MQFSGSRVYKTWKHWLAASDEPLYVCRAGTNEVDIMYLHIYSALDNV